MECIWCTRQNSEFSVCCSMNWEVFSHWLVGTESFLALCELRRLFPLMLLGNIHLPSGGFLVCTCWLILSWRLVGNFLVISRVFFMCSFLVFSTLPWKLSHLGLPGLPVPSTQLKEIMGPHLASPPCATAWTFSEGSKLGHVCFSLSVSPVLHSLMSNVLKT